MTPVLTAGYVAGATVFFLPSRRVSDSDEAEKKQRPTVAWDPDEVTGSGSVGNPPPEPASSSDDDPLVGQLIRDKWLVLERLGAGSYGTVYKVRDVTGGWIEALKILGVDRITGAHADTVRKRFLREAQIMKRLGNESPHIVGLSTYEEDLEAGLIYFLMEFVEGRSLAELLEAEGPPGLDRTLSIALQACEALIVAHEGPEPVVHRDLKLENLMLATDRSGREIVKVLDFGIAKIAESDPDSRLTTVGTLGTPGYAAPEQIRAEEVDGRTDLFALGVILYALLTGRDPWLGKPAHEPTHQIYDLMAASERGVVIPMERTGIDLPSGVENVVLRLLRRDPEERFQSARELREVLSRLAEGGGLSDAGVLRVQTDEPGVEVEIRSGRRTVSRGPTPCVVSGLGAGSYRILLRDPRFEPVETGVDVGEGASEEVTLVTTPRSDGTRTVVRRRAGVTAAAVGFGLLVAGLLVVRPWGRVLDLPAFAARAEAGEITSVRLASGSLEGRLQLGFLSAPVRAPLDEARGASAVKSLRAAGVAVDASGEVVRLIEAAAEAQGEMRYFGQGPGTVRDLAQRALTLDPESEEAMALLRKVAERMAWDADAALGEGAPDQARELVDQCLSLVDRYPRCVAVAREL